MMKLLNKIINLFEDDRHRRAEQYLSQSVDHADLERRIKRLENKNLKDWI